MNVIIDYNGGNVHSLKGALERIGATATVSADPDVIRAADRVFFPGVGHFQAAMQDLKTVGLHKVIPTLTQPFLGICLGMQLLGNFSEEGARPGLGVLSFDVLRIKDAETVPHMGWNSLEAMRGPLFQGIAPRTDFYFVHSYAVDVNASTIARSTHGTVFSAAVQQNNFYGVQFHPEKSGEAGETLLRNFLAI